MRARRMRRERPTENSTGEEPLNERKYLVTACSVLLAILVFFFFQPLFLGKTIWPADYLLAIAPWSAHQPAGYTGPSNHLLFDNIFVFYPWYDRAVRMVSMGIFPLWNPYSACGLPFFANSTGFLFPLNICFLVLPLWYAFSVYAFLKLFFAGLFMYLFLRKVSVGFTGSLVGSVSFMFSSFMIGWLGHPHTSIALCLPLLFLLVERLVNASTSTNAALLSLAISITLLGGHYETSIHVLAAACLYFLFRLIVRWQEDRTAVNVGRSAVLAGIALAVGIGLAAIQLLPAWEYISRSSLLKARPESALQFNFSAEAFAGAVRSLRALVFHVIPDYFGNPVDRNEWSDSVGIGVMPEQGAYIGILPLFCAMLAVVHSIRQKQVFFFSTLALLCLGIAHQVPLLADIMAALPVFSKLNNNRLLLVYGFAAAVLAARGTDLLIQHGKTDRAIRPSLAALLFLSAAAAGSLWWVVTNGPFAQAAAEQDATGYVTGKILLFLFLALASLALMYLGVKRSISPKTFSTLIILIAAADLLAAGVRFWPAHDPALLYPKTNVIDFLNRDREPFRIYGIGKVLSVNTSVPLGLSDIRGYDGISLRTYEEFITTKSGDITFWMSGNSVPRHLDLMNVKYVIAPAGPDISNTRFSRVYSGEVDVYRNNTYLSRAFVVRKAVTIRDDREALAYAYSLSFDPAHEAILSADLPAGHAQRLTGSQAVPQPAPRVVESEANTFAVSVDMQSPGLLVVSNTYYPGWRVSDNGQEIDLYRTDYNFQSVFLDKGDHRVVFSYTPSSFRVGMLLSALSLCIIVSPCIFRSIAQLRNRKGSKQ